jgi:signal peptidase II
MTRIGVRLVLLVAIAGTIGCDRATKYIAASTLLGTPGRSFLADTVRLEYVENSGGFLSLGAQLPPPLRTGVFTVGTGLALLALVGAAIRFRWSGWPLLGLSLFVAGGASNWVDRVARGSVIDFINVGVGPLRTGIFNVADVAIMLGVAIVILTELRRATDAEPLKETQSIEG